MTTRDEIERIITEHQRAVQEASEAQEGPGDAAFVAELVKEQGYAVFEALQILASAIDERAPDPRDAKW